MDRHIGDQEGRAFVQREGLKLLRRWCHVASIVALLVSWSASCALAQTDQPNTEGPNKPAISTPDHESSSQDNPKSESSVEKPNTNTSSDTAQSKDPKNNPPPKPLDWIAISAIVQGASAAAVALFTCVLVWFNWGLWTETQKAADAADRSAKTASDALVAVQRAFVSASNKLTVRFITWTSEDAQAVPHASFHVEFTNAGTTPALDVIGRIVVLRSAEKPSHATILGPDTDYSVGYIAPKGFYYFEADKPEIDAFGMKISGRPAGAPMPITQMRNDNVYVFGWVGYRDIFGRPHVTQYCYSLAKMAYVVQTGDVLWNWVDIANLCGVDDACPNYAAIVAKLPQRQTEQNHNDQSQEPRS
jgi:hypothetical protein